MSLARRLLVVLLALLLAVQVIRNAGVHYYVERNPELAARIWPGHPEAEIALGMAEIGRAAAQRKPAPETVFALMNDAARQAPLAPEPLIVAGVRAQLSDHLPLAVEAFQAAAARDPRSLPAHYFLADALFRSGDAANGLGQVGILARLAPNGVSSVAPYVAAYAKDPKTWPQLRTLFRTKPELKETALTALAADPANADTVMALAGGPPAADSSWLPTLLNSLVAAHEYERARSIWAGAARVHTPGLLYDAEFRAPGALPPFNWVLVSSMVGIAERQRGGGLHVIFYGHEDGLLARQLLVLAPGRYRLSIELGSLTGGANALNWSVRCDGSQIPLGAVPVGAAAKALDFVVPANCLAQWLELSGVTSDVSQQSEATIRRIDLAGTGQ